MKNALCYIWNKIRQRKFWMIAGVFAFVVEVYLFTGPAGWLREEKTNFLSGATGWSVSATSDNIGFCQEFVPEHKELKSLSVVAIDEGGFPWDGEMLFTVTDSRNNVLFSQTFSYQEMIWNQFMDIEVGLTLSTKEKYYLTLNFLQDESEPYPSVMVCSKEDYLPENTVLMQGDEMEDTQLVTRYVYTNALDRKKTVKVCFMCLLTAFAIMFGLPRNQKIRRIVGAVILLAIPYALGRRLELLTINTMFLLPFSLKWSMAIMYGIELVVLLLTCSLRFTTVFISAFLTIAYSVNYFFYSFRGGPFKLNELTAARTALDVVGEYNLRPNEHLAMAWCIALFFIAWGLASGKPIRCKNVLGDTEERAKNGFKQMVTKKIWMHCLSALAGIVLMVTIGYQFLATDFLENNGFVNLRGFDAHMMYHFNGFLISTLLDVKNSKIDKPEGYSIEVVEDALQSVEKETYENTGELPHIILVMNESFSDLRVWGDLQLSQDNLSFYNSLSDNTVRGYVNASVIGGGTANSEFEVFTGCSMGLLPSSYYAYQQCMNKPVDSMISNMEKNGYTTYAMHPAGKTNWNRDRVYKYLDFDQCYWLEDFEGAEELHFGAKDSETYKKVVELYENRKENEKLFIFDLTIQNHGGYDKLDLDEEVEAVNLSSKELNQYLTLIKSSDEDFEELVHYFEQQDEKVIICMFGDHQPVFLEDGLYESICGQTEGLTEADLIMNQYKTPFVIWANYDIPEQKDIDISLNYLGVLLMKTAGLQMSDYFWFLNQQMEEYPIITINGYEDADGKLYEWSGTGEEFLTYRMLQYNYLFDNNTVKEGF